MHTFQSLGLSQPLLEAIESIGFQSPTPIQVLAIPQLIQKPIDLIGLAQTGTGKTAAFGLPLIQLTDAGTPAPQMLVLAPTRELALQISGELERFASAIPSVRIVTVYGGADMRAQVRALNRGAQVVVATPGRLKDLMLRGKIRLDAVRYVVLDEADEMLNMGFRPDLDEILEATPAHKNTWLFSATMSKEVQKLSRKYLKDPLQLSAGERNVANEDIEHQFILLRRSEKYEALRRLVDYHSGFFGLVFCRTRRDVKNLSARLNADGYPADAIHGDLSQSQRETVMERFRNRGLKVLVATDVAARGIDVQDITHVIHFNIPEDLAFYTHRSGRTGRAGKEGTSVVLLTRKERSQIKQIERRSQVRFTEVTPPTGASIIRKKLRDQLRAIKDAQVQQELQPLLPELTSELAGLSKDELIARLASRALEGLTKRYSDNQEFGDKPGAGQSREHTRLFINVGRKDGYQKADFLRLVCETAGIDGEAIGKIDLQHTYSHFEIRKELAKPVMRQFSDTYMEGRKLRVNPADAGRKSKKKKNKKRRKHTW